MAVPAVASTTQSTTQSRIPRRIGRYDLHEEIASGGMATVYLARQIGATGFTRPVAVKRLHDNLATDPQFVSMLLDEARVAARVRHPNVVATLDVVEEEREVVVVMEYVHGESLATLRKITADRGERIPARLAATIVAGALHGLHAAHEATDELGAPLHIVHRDVSPQNILVGVDGVPRVLDFGIAKAAGRMQTTQDGALKGKFGYMAPEQLKHGEVTGRADVYAAAVVLWEALAGQRLYPEDADAATILTKILFEEVRKLSSVVPDLPEGADDVIARGLAKEPEARYATALEMATDVERVFGLASPVEVSSYVKEVAKEAIRRKSESLAIVERADTEGGQKRRREVVARVAAGGPEGAGRQRRTLWFAVAGATIVTGLAVGFLMRRDQTAIPGPELRPLVTPSAVAVFPSASTRATDAPPAVAVDAAIPALSASAPSASASVESVALKPAVRKPKRPDKVETVASTGSAHVQVPLPATPPTASEEAGRDLIPKFRK